MLVHVMRAQKLARTATRDDAALEALRKSGDLSQVRAETGANMLLVYLLTRWGRLGAEAGAITPDGEAFHTEVLEAYLARGCAADEGATPRQLYTHTPPSFRELVALRGQRVSAIAFVQAMIAQLHPDMFADAYAQLQRVAERLGAGPRGKAPPAARAGSNADARVLLVRGTRSQVSLGAEALATLRQAAAALGLAVVIGGDEERLAPGSEVDVVVGRVLAAASAEDDGPTAVPRLDDEELSADQRRFLEPRGPVGLILLATGPLASGALVRGVVMSAAQCKKGRFFVGATRRQDAHARGVCGEEVAKATWSPRACSAPWSADLYLVARYD